MRLVLTKRPAFEKMFSPSVYMFDQLLVERRKAREKGDYKLADAMRSYAEFHHQRTINDTTVENPSGDGFQIEPGHDYQQYRILSDVEWLTKFKDILTFDGEPLDVFTVVANTGDSKFGKTYGSYDGYFWDI
jgi:hypothetical protein